MADRKAVIDMTDVELEVRYREVIQQQGQDAAMTLMEISRRSTLKVRDAAFEVRDASLMIHEASLEIVRLSKKLESLTKGLIALTILLGMIGLPPAIEVAMKYVSHNTRRRLRNTRISAGTVDTKDVTKSKTATATPTTTAAKTTATAATSTAPAPQKSKAPRDATVQKP
jgi:hypothetical protein